MKTASISGALTGVKAFRVNMQQNIWRSDFRLMGAAHIMLQALHILNNCLSQSFHVECLRNVTNHTLTVQCRHFQALARFHSISAALLPTYNSSVVNDRSNKLASILLLILVTAIALWLGDGIFRLYERSALTASYTPTGDSVDLQSLNYNDSFATKSKDKSIFRILSFGDSFCYSIVKFESSYNGVIENKIEIDGRKTRVVNFGEPCSSFPQYMAAMCNWLPQVEHDAVLVNIFLGNDLSEVAHADVPSDSGVNRIMGENFVDVQTGRKRMSHVPHKFPLRMLDYAYAYYLYATEGGYVLRDIPEPYNHALGPLSPENYQRTCARHLEACDPDAVETLRPGYEALDRLAVYLSDLRRSGVKVLILLSPAEVQTDDALLAKTAAAMHVSPSKFDVTLPNTLVTEHIMRIDPQLDVLDLLPMLRAARTGGAKAYYPMESHWSAEGNRLVGENTAQWMASHWEEYHATR